MYTTVHMFYIYQEAYGTLRLTLFVVKPPLYCLSIRYIFNTSHFFIRCGPDGERIFDVVPIMDGARNSDYVHYCSYVLHLLGSICYKITSYVTPYVVRC